VPSSPNDPHPQPQTALTPLPATRCAGTRPVGAGRGGREARLFHRRCGSKSFKSKSLKGLKGLKSLNFCRAGWGRFFEFDIELIAAAGEGPDPLVAGDDLLMRVLIATPRCLS
jgi:hypothetical protein